MSDATRELIVADALTENQRRLYLTSATFRAGVDCFLLQVLPTFFAGLELRAETEDAERQKLIQIAAAGERR